MHSITPEEKIKVTRNNKIETIGILVSHIITCNFIAVTAFQILLEPSMVLVAIKLIIVVGLSVMNIISFRLCRNDMERLFYAYI